MKNLILILGLTLFSSSSILAQTDSTETKNILQEAVVSGLQANQKNTHQLFFP